MRKIGGSYLFFEREVLFELLDDLEGHVDRGGCQDGVVLALHEFVVVHVHLGEVDADFDQVFEVLLV